jgi:hypothetical protein
MSAIVRALVASVRASERLLIDHPRVAILCWSAFAVAWWIVAIVVVPDRNRGAGYVAGALVTIGASWSVWRVIGRMRADRRLQAKARRGSASGGGNRGGPEQVRQGASNRRRGTSAP